MKANLFDKTGKKIKQIESEIFNSKIREDIAQRIFEAEKRIQPYASFPEAGKRHSASGRIRHQRHKWRTSYGHGISRVPRKIFWRRGTQFYWVGAEVSGTRGGRKSHPPRAIHFQKTKKVNKKEILMAFKSAIAATGNQNWLKKRYETIKDAEVPIIINPEILKLKTKEFFSILEIILGENFRLVLKKKNVRAGKGKIRGRKYKENAGLLLVIGEDEKAKFQGIEIMKSNELEMQKLFPLGRLSVYTESAIAELNKLGEKAEVENKGNKK